MKQKILFILFFSLTFYSCSKKEGCIDITAVNYDISADTDDGSCVYNGCFDPLSVNYTPNPIPNSDLDTVCLSLNKTWIADSYIVNGVQYITNSSITLIYAATSSTEGSYQMSGTSHQGYSLVEDGTYSYDLDNLNMSHTFDGNTYYLSVDKFTNDELDLTVGAGTPETASINFYSE